MADYSYLGVGKVYLRKIGATEGLTEVGNVSALSINTNEQVIELRDYTQAGGGTYNEVRRIESTDLSMTLHDLNKDNLARATLGVGSTISTGAVTGESHTAYIGAFIPTNKPSTSAIVVKEGMDTLVLNTDYERVPGGIVVKSGGAIANGDTITFDYTPSAGSQIEALLTAAQEYELFFSGLNEARSGKQVTVRIHRAKIGATAALGLIGDEFAALELTGRALKDTAKNGTTESQYFVVQVVD